MAFRGYQRRSAEHVEKRATQQSGDFKGFIKDEHRTWTPRKGENWIRILPPTWNDPKHYGIEIYAHYSVGPEKASVICNLKQNSTRCALCDARSKAEHNNATEEELREFKWSKRVVLWIIDMKDQEKGPQVWVAPWTVDRDIAKISKDRRTGDTYFIDDPDEGYDVYFDRDGDGIGTKYAGFALARSPSSVATKDLDFVEEHPLDQVLVQRDYGEVMSLYTGGMDQEEPRQNTSRDVRSERRDRDDRGRNNDRCEDVRHRSDDRDDRDRRDDVRDERDNRERRDRDDSRNDRYNERRSNDQDVPFDERRVGRTREYDQHEEQERFRRDGERRDPPRDEPRDGGSSNRRRVGDSSDDRRRDMDRTLGGDDIPERASGRDEQRRDDRGDTRQDDRERRPRQDDREISEGGGQRAQGLRARLAADREQNKR